VSDSETMQRPAPEPEDEPRAKAGEERPGLSLRASLGARWAALPLRWRRAAFWANRIACWALAAGAGGSLLWASLYGLAPVPGTALMVQRAVEGQDVRYRWRPLSQISPNLVRAVIAAEDARFCAHSGFDFEAIESALRAAESGGRLRGASTISQQTAKNAYLFPWRSWARKGAEAWFTVLDEALWTKRRTMEVYLNVAEWGDGLFGAEAAAQARFGKSAAELSAREAALMAAVLPNPNTYRLDPPGPYVAGRAGSLQARMGEVRASGLDSCIY